MSEKYNISMYIYTYCLMYVATLPRWATGGSSTPFRQHEASTKNLSTLGNLPRFGSRRAGPSEPPVTGTEKTPQIMVLKNSGLGDDPFLFGGLGLFFQGLKRLKTIS